jgi:hypothetical protein
MNASAVSTTMRDRTVVADSLPAEPDCECMLCDLPMGAVHAPIEWRVTVHFPGPYPTPGDEDMLLCQHCMREWTEGEWMPPYDNFRITCCARV